MKRKMLLLAGFIMVLFTSCLTKKTLQMNSNPIYAIRLKPGADLKRSILQFATENKLSAGWIATCVGSLTTCNLRFANQSDGTQMNGHFEIVSLVGTISENGSHLHLSVSDSTGKTTGGHLMDGCIIYTTAEIVIQSTNSLTFRREKDGSTPWEELMIYKNE